MALTTAIVYTSLVISIITAIFLFKNVVISYRLGYKGPKKILLFTLLLVTLVIALSSVESAFFVRGLIHSRVYDDSLTKEMLLAIKGEIKQGTITSIVFLVICIATFIGHWITYKSIQADIQKDVDMPKERWNWGRIKGNNQNITKNS